MTRWACHCCEFEIFLENYTFRHWTFQGFWLMFLSVRPIPELNQRVKLFEPIFYYKKRNHKKVTQSYDWIMDGLSIFYIPHENKKMNEIIVYCKVIVLRKINVFIQIKKLTWANKNFQWHCHNDRVFRKSRICGSSAFVDFDVMLGKIENIFVVNSCENVISNLVCNA